MTFRKHGTVFQRSISSGLRQTSSNYTSCMTLSKSPKLSYSQFPDMSHEVGALSSQGEGEDKVK